MKKQKSGILLGGIFAIVTFVLLYVSIAIILNQDITVKNLVVYVIFSFLVGMIVSAFTYTKRSVGLIIFIIAYVIAFATMINAFLSDLSGWQDLIGLFQMIVVLGIGALLGAVAELALYFNDKRKRTIND